MQQLIPILIPSNRAKAIVTLTKMWSLRYTFFSFYPFFLSLTLSFLSSFLLLFFLCFRLYLTCYSQYSYCDDTCNPSDCGGRTNYLLHSCNKTQDAFLGFYTCNSTVPTPAKGQTTVQRFYNSQNCGKPDAWDELDIFQANACVGSMSPLLPFLFIFLSSYFFIIKLTFVFFFFFVYYSWWRSLSQLCYLH